MGRFHIAAAASPGAAEEANKEQVNFTASVIDHDGDPVKNLETKAFDLASPIVGPGGPPADLGVAAEVSPGVYVLNAIPRRQWARGTYLYVLTVEDGNDRGQTVIPVTVPGV
jgi:hypothetical protein